MPTLQDRVHITTKHLTDEVLINAGFDPSKIDRKSRRKLAGVVDKIAFLNDYDAAKRRNQRVEGMTPDDRNRINDQIQLDCRDLANLISAAGGDTDQNAVRRACDTLGRRFASIAS